MLVVAAAAAVDDAYCALDTGADHKKRVSSRRRIREVGARDNQKLRRLLYNKRQTESVQQEISSDEQRRQGLELRLQVPVEVGLQLGLELELTVELGLRLAAQARLPEPK